MTDLPSPAATPVRSERRPDLDAVRIGAFGLLILYHVGMFYVPWDWHVKSPRLVEPLEWGMYLLNPWRLSLLFLVSGAATRFMADRLSAGALFRLRSWRLLPPLAFAMLVIVPPQTWLQVREALEPGLTYADFYPRYLTASGDWRIDGETVLTPTWNHLWFVAYLFAYTALLCGLLAGWKRFPQAAEAAGAVVAGSLRGWGLLVWPVVYLAAIRVILLPLFPIEQNLVGDWYNHALSFAFFLAGYALAKRGAVWDAMAARRRLALALWLGAYAVFMPYAWAYRADDAVPPTALRDLMRVVHAVQEWCAPVVILGYARRYVTRRTPAMAYLSEGVFPAYIVHQTLIILVAVPLSHLALPLPLEGLLLVVAVYIGCWLTYELVRRVAPLRPLFGLKLRPDARPSRPVPDEAATGA